jgi:uncharacterized integral membrane protein
MLPLFQALWRILLLVLRVVLFLILFLIAITNTTSVEFHWFINQSLSLPLNMLLFSAFLLGLMISAFVLFPRKRRG